MLTKYTSLLAIPFVALIGCGGDDGGHNPVVKMDAGSNTPPIDSPPAATCSISPLVLDGLGFGSMSMPIESSDPARPADWFDVFPDDSAMAGQTELFIIAGLPPADPSDTTDDRMVFEVVKGNSFLLNSPINFETDPDKLAGTYAAASYIFGDIIGAGTPGATITNFYFATSGSVTLTAVNEAQNGITTGTVNATNYHEIDDQNAEVPTGCKPSLTGLPFGLKQQAAANATGKPTHISRAEAQLMIDRIHQFKASRAAQAN